MKNEALTQLKSWFQHQKRELPWRENPTPYAVWVSEMMLQQTQVAVVIPFYERWMKRFPTLEALAKAPLDSVLKEWEGLGYYSRARYLHEGARYVMENFAGQLPASEHHLTKIKGIGPYTKGAILSFAFHQRKAAVDGNVMRVLSRYYCVESDIKSRAARETISSLAEEMLPLKEPWIISEALIELGATVCGKSPQCGICPLKKSCRGYAEGKAQILPIKSKKMATTFLYRAVGVILFGNDLLIRQNEKGKVMSDLCEFPYFDIECTNLENISTKHLIQQQLPFKLVWKKEFETVFHSFTRYRAQLFPHFFVAKDIKNIPGYTWINIDKLKKLPFSSGHRQIFSKLQVLHL